MNLETRASGSLAGVLMPDVSAAKNLSLIAGGAAVTAVAAQVQIPWQPVPFTMQTLAVALCGLALGARRGAAAQALYLAVGFAGLPVFAEGKFGPAVLLGPTGGFLLAFIPIAFLLGWVADRGLDRKPLSLASALLASNVVLFGLGWAWLAVLIGPVAAFWGGVAPFLLSEAVKDLIAVLALPAAWALIGRR